MLRLNNSCCECNPQICLGLRVRRVCAACGQTMAIFHSELPCPILFLISQLIRTTILRPLLVYETWSKTFINFTPAWSEATRFCQQHSFLSPYSREEIFRNFLFLVESVVKFFETRFEEKFSTIQFRSKHEADSWDTKGGEKKSLLSLEDIFSTLSGDGVSSYRPRLHLDSRLLVL